MLRFTCLFIAAATAASAGARPLTSAVLHDASSSAVSASSGVRKEHSSQQLNVVPIWPSFGVEKVARHFART